MDASFTATRCRGKWIRLDSTKIDATLTATRSRSNALEGKLRSLFGLVFMRLAANSRPGSSVSKEKDTGLRSMRSNRIDSSIKTQRQPQSWSVCAWAPLLDTKVVLAAESSMGNKLMTGKQKGLRSLNWACANQSHNEKGGRHAHHLSAYVCCIEGPTHRLMS